MGIFKTLKDIVKGKTVEADKALKSSQAVTLGHQAIADSKKEVEEHRQRIGNFSARIKIQKKNLVEAQEDVKKWTSIATKKAGDGDADAARTALTEKNKHASTVKTLKSEIAQNETVLNREKASLAKLQDRTDSAEGKIENLTIRKEGADMRKAQTGIGSGGSAFGALDDLEDQVDKAEAEAEAYEEMSGVGNEAALLEEEFDSGSSDVDEELAKLMAKNKSD